MIEFNTHPDRYAHFNLSFDGATARLALDVDASKPFRGDHELKLNSYDLGVDIELQDAIQRVRFEHPEVKVVVVTSDLDRVFCAGANIPMLAASTHPFKVNFCKFTNETRLAIEDASKHSGIRFVAALNGPTAGGGYELAISCDEIYLVDDGNSTVSLPEVPLLGVLPGTGGLTRLVDKRKIRRDLADVFSTLAEGVRGKKAKKWRLIDDFFPRSRFAESVGEVSARLAGELPARAADGKGITLGPIERTETETGFRYHSVAVELDPARRVARLTLFAPEGEQPQDGAGYLAAGDSAWAVRAFRELDDAICQLRFEYPDIGLILLETRGEIDTILEVEKHLLVGQDHWLMREILLQMARVLRRFELTGRSLFALVDGGSAFGGSFCELALACDRIYMLDDPDHPCELAIGPLSAGALPMSNGLTRLQSRFLNDPDHAARLAADQPRVNGPGADELGLVTVLADDIDWEDEVRIAMEERVSLSPDALTGMEASLRFGGAETCETKIFGRLSAWQNWIFTRPNATGDHGALVLYGRPETASFDWRRT
jgi:benzoyl-CoA-dihydrodiol lyase